jgi:hypothetical protein
MGQVSSKLDALAYLFAPLLLEGRLHQDVITVNSSMNQVVRKSFRPCIRSSARRETYSQSNECTLFFKVIGAAGSGLE